MVQTYIHPGELPAFWDRTVVFFANLMSMFFDNKEEIKELENEVSGAQTYGGRLLPVINLLFQGGRNLLILEKEPSESILKYLQEDLKLGLPEFMLLPRDIYEAIQFDQCGSIEGDHARDMINLISHHPAKWVDGFVTEKRLMMWAQKINKSNVNTEDGCRKGNNKLYLYNHLLEKGLPVFDTEIALDPGDVARCLKILYDMGYERAVVKSQIGASGIGMLKLNTCEQNPQVREYIFHEGPCLIQGWMNSGILGIERVDSPSVQLFVGDRSIHIYDITEQILSEESVHQGNIAPPPYIDDCEGVKGEIILQSIQAGNWLHSQGYRGTASIDFLVVTRTSKTEVIICEINARVTGATYPAILARSFMPHGAWIMRNVKTDRPIDGEELMRTLENAGALFYPGERGGFLPINFNLDENGKVIKGQFLYIADNFKDCVEGIYDFHRVLPLEWQYDRD
jgi:hypothetical protein